MIRLATLCVAGLLFVPAMAGETVPSSEIVGGLPRKPLLGAAVGPAEGGLEVQGVGPGTAAEKMGLQPGDRLVSVDGQAVSDAASFVAAIARKKTGETVKIAVRRGEESRTLEGALGPRPLEQQADYAVEYGSLEVPGGGGKRRTIVTRPKSAGKHPAVMLIGGIGCYSLDGILRPAELHDAYAKLLDAWTRAGYVTMRVEKTGMGDSEGIPCADPRADFELESRGYAAGLAQLQGSDFVDGKNVFVFAHSIGPLVAAKIAAERPVRALVVAETVGTSWYEYDLTNVRRQLLLAGAPYDEVDRGVRHHEVCAHRFFVDKQSLEQLVAGDATCANEIIAPQPFTYMQQIGALDLAPLWKKIDAPVLIFYGTADFVTDDSQHQYLRDMINAFHPGRATYIKIDGMDHGLLLAGSQQAAFAGPGESGPPPFATKVLDETLRFFQGARS